MATTRLADLIVQSPIFAPTVVDRIRNGSVLRLSGIAADDAELAGFANGPGDVLTVRRWNDLTGASNVSTDDPAQVSTPDKINMGQSLARKIRRNKSWQVADLTRSFMAEDPMDVITQLVADYWVREEQRVLVQILNGVFAASSMAGLTLAPTGVEAGATTPQLMTATVSSNAHALLGDQGMDLVAVAMHSRVFWNLDAQGASTYAENPMGLTPQQRMNTRKFWHGKEVIVTDGIPSRAGTTSGTVYTSYFFGGDAFGYAEAQGPGGPKVPAEIDRTPAAGNGEGVETFYSRRHWVMHPRGISFTGTPASAAGVTDAELATGTNWTLATDPKNMRIVRVLTNG